jgi:hypothetical protein
MAESIVLDPHAASSATEAQAPASTVRRLH